jgi:hypothetical protein
MKPISAMLYAGSNALCLNAGQFSFKLPLVIMMPRCKNLVARSLAATPQGLIEKPLLCCLASFRYARIWEKDETG